MPKSRNFQYEALNTLKMYLMDFTRIMYLEPIRGLTASHAPELHWQVAVMHRGLPPKIIF